MDNDEIAAAFREVADLLEIEGANPFRVRAYQNAAHTLEGLGEPLARRLAAGDDLTELPGFGPEMARHATELLETGRLNLLDELAERVPRGLLEVVALPGIGPKRAKELWQKLGIRSLADLGAAVTAGRIATLPGFGPKTQVRLLALLKDRRQAPRRFKISEADRAVQSLSEHLRACPELGRFEAAGSFRRRKETVGDLDFVATSAQPEAVMAHFLAYPAIERVDGAGDTRATVVQKTGLQVDLRVVPEVAFGAALLYFTGSKEHTVALRQRAVERGLRLSEYGLFEATERGEDGDPWAGERRAGETEEGIYRELGYAFIPPELREDRGELAAAEAGRLPRLLELGDLRGDLHLHSTWSDGRASIEEMVAAGVERGYEYLAVTDHSQALAMTGGLDAAAVRRQAREIDEVAARHPEIRIFKGLEVDILADGGLDLDDESLATLDLVLVSVHSRFELPEKEQTERILRAVAHPLVHVLAHPTGRKIGRRKPLDFDLDRVLQACRDHGVAVELNAGPSRLDLKDTHLMRAKELGVDIVISTDAHQPKHLDHLRFGVDQARRAWLTAGDVVNTKRRPALEKWLARKR